MNKDDIKTAVLGAIWAFEKTGYTNEELADEVNRLLPWPAEETQKRTAQRNTELLADHIRDKQEIAKTLGTDPIHNHMKREVEELIQETRQLKDQLVHISKTQAENMHRLDNMIDKRQEALRYISEIIEEKAANREDLEIGSTAYKSLRRWASEFLHNVRAHTRGAVEGREK